MPFLSADLFNKLLSTAALLMACCPSVNAHDQEKDKEHKNHQYPKESCTQKLKNEDLGFGLDKLDTLLKNKSNPPEMMLVKGNRGAFEIDFIDVQIAGWRSLSTGKVAQITVYGKGKYFAPCVNEIIRLCNSHNHKVASSISERISTSLSGRDKSEQLFEQSGIRYSLQEFSGVNIFHCTNARLNNKANQKAQPG